MDCFRYHHVLELLFFVLFCFFPFYFISFLFGIPKFIVYAHTQCSMQYVPSIIPTTRLTQPPPFSPPKPSVSFSESPVSHGLSPPLISPNSLLLPISQCPPCYSLCFRSKWNHMIIDSLCLTYFTQHNLLQSVHVSTKVGYSSFLMEA